jgi:hypothetical protein
MDIERVAALTTAPRSLDRLRARHRMTSRETLTPAALAFRAIHAAISILFLLAIGHVWWCALTGRRGRLLRLAVVGLGCEGLLVTANHGDCPLGGLQARLGDPIPLFELLLSPRAARRAVPALGAIAVAGIALLARSANDE